MDATRYDGANTRQRAWLEAFPDAERLLEGAGAGVGAAVLPPQPAFKAGIDALVMTLGARLGAPADQLAALLAEEDVSELGPFSAFKREVDALRSLVAIEPDAAARSRSVLARILAGSAFDGDPPTRFGSYPKVAQKALKAGTILAASDADIWVAYPVGSGYHVAHAHPETFEVVAQSVEEFIRQELERMFAPGVSRPDAGR
jgi:hypothetical protein